MKIFTGFILFLVCLQPVVAQKIDVYQRPVQHERSRDFDALHYRVSLNIDMENKSLAGENRITLVPLNDNFDKCVLDAEFLVVSSITNEKGEQLSFDQKEKQIFISMSKTYNHADTIIFTVKYSLNKSVPGLLFIDETGSNPKMVSSDCWPDKARQWIPCYDYPNDKATNEMIVTVDKKYKVLSNGKLAGVKENSLHGTMTYHWSQELPHSTYLINLSIADYAVIKDSLGSLPVNYWVYKGLESEAKTSFRKTPSIISFYNKLFCYDYPWAKYDQVITSYMGGGAEATTATLLGEGIVMDTLAEKDFSREGVIAHEIAHQWWGDLITLRSWEHNWLNESFATYSDYLYTRFDKGEDAGAFDLLGKKNQYLNEAHNKYLRPIVFNRFNGPADNFDSHAYPKGACMLHLLRHILGDETFFRTLSIFLHQYAFKPVDTYDLMKTIKEVSGKNMDWFFDQYIFSPGHPVFEVSKSWNETGKKMTLTILQKQDSIREVPIYTIPVNLGFVFPDKKTTKEVWLKDKSTTLEFEFDSEPLLVRFDEGNFLLKECRFKKSLQELLYHAGHDDMIGRLTALKELEPYNSERAVLLLWANLATQDNFWAVRQAALENIGKYNCQNGIELFKACLRDKNSKVRKSAVKILGELRDPGFIRLFKEMFKAENSYAVQAELVKSIGKCGGQQQLQFLKNAEAIKSYGNVVSKASTEAISLITKKLASPNIILIVTDDQRWDMLGCAGNNIIQTPNIDNLANQGVRFTHAFVTTPICAASRASIITGLFERTHEYTFNKPPIKKAFTDNGYPHLLRQAGYRTGFVGKFGVKTEDAMDSLFSWSEINGFPYWKIVDGKRKHLTDIQGEQAIQFIRESTPGKPFCLSLSFSAPHADDDSKEQYFWPESLDSLYQNAVIPVPATADPAFYEALPEFLKGTMNRERWYWRFNTPERFQHYTKGYYRMITGIDQVIGKIRKELDVLKIAGNTVILLMGDNGYYIGDRGYADKWLMHDVSIRVPLVFYDPRSLGSNSKVLDQMVLNVDVSPTILDLAGISIPRGIQGKSLLPLISGADVKWRNSIFCEHLMNEPRIPNSECIRTEDWKFIRYPKHPEYIELYDLKNDPWEEHNLSGNPQFKNQILKYQKQCDAKIKQLTGARVEK